MILLSTLKTAVTVSLAKIYQSCQSAFLTFASKSRWPLLLSQLNRGECNTFVMQSSFDIVQ